MTENRSYKTIEQAIKENYLKVNSILETEPESEPEQEVTLEREIKSYHTVESDNTFNWLGFVMKIVEPNHVKVINIDTCLVKKSSIYYICGHYSDGTYYETKTRDLARAMKELADCAVRTRP